MLNNTLPGDISVYLIAVEDTRLEIQLSDAVKAAGEKVAGKILEELQ
ncbi:MAG: hypothetical protein LRY55_05965 [Leadbetterella sp.]|nr:hypothetical protein [Leadbetterella sp.]